MKLVILAGGTQSVLSDRAENIPKPMLDIGGKPLLWHIMQHFSLYGINEFIICGGYKVDMIKDYFNDYYIYASDITVDLRTNTIETHRQKTEDWVVTVVDTGLDTTTGNRISKIRNYIGNETFIVTYGDCLSDMDISGLINTHRESESIATMAIVKPSGRKSLLPVDDKGNLTSTIDADSISGWINGDCFVFNSEVFEVLKNHKDLESGLVEELTKSSQIKTYRHNGFWTTIETKRDLAYAESLWESGQRPWIKGKIKE